MVSVSSPQEMRLSGRGKHSGRASLDKVCLRRLDQLAAKSESRIEVGSSVYHCRYIFAGFKNFNTHIDLTSGTGKRWINWFCNISLNNISLLFLLVKK